MYASAKAEKFAEQHYYLQSVKRLAWKIQTPSEHYLGNRNGQAWDVDMNATQDWTNKVWPKLKDKYAPNTFAKEKIVWEENSSKSVLPTILLTANMSGTEKRKVLIIGKSKKSRCVKNIKQLPVT